MLTSNVYPKSFAQVCSSELNTNISYSFDFIGCPVGYAFSQIAKSCVLNCLSCQRNESYSACGTRCEATCSNPTNAGTSCIQVCKEGCYCNKGYVRDINGFCVRIADCPSKINRPVRQFFNHLFFTISEPCPENETFLCGNPLCERNCQTLGHSCTKYPIRCESEFKNLTANRQ